MTKGIKGHNSPKDKPDIEPDRSTKYVLLPNPESNKTMELFKKLYLKAMYDLDTAGVITFHDRDLIEESVGDGKPFPSFTALGEVYGFYPAEISNIRSGVRKMKSDRIRILLQGLEKLKRNG